MISRLDIYRAAKLLIDRHGEDAPIRAYFPSRSETNRSPLAAEGQVRRCTSCGAFFGWWFLR
jgi:hypothetical protein